VGSYWRINNFWNKKNNKKKRKRKREKEKKEEKKKKKSKRNHDKLLPTAKNRSVCVCVCVLVLRLLEGILLNMCWQALVPPPNDVPSIPWSPVVLPLWTPWGAC
jgi:hypothetical protein